MRSAARKTNLQTALARLVVVLVACTAGSGSAQIYQYVNDDGTLEFTTRPRAGRTADRVIGAGEQRQEPPRYRTSRTNPNPNAQHDAFDGLIREAANAYGVPFAFIKAVIRVESAFDPHAVSHAGAMGLMQLMPRTAESLNCADPFDPRQNIMAGTQYLRILTDRYNGDMNLTLAAYNAGSGAVARAGGIPFENTRRYIERVYQYYHEYLNAGRN